MNGPTETQLAALDWIRGFVAERGFAPTVTEIMDGLGLGSRSTVQRYLARLEHHGLIRRHRGAHRGIEVLAGREP